MTHDHPLFARLWALLGPRAVARRDREALVAGLEGAVLEVGAGTGTNFALYPPSVTRVLAIEPEPHLRAAAREAAAAAPVSVEVVDAEAEGLPVPDASVDAVVLSLVLCSVADQAAALAELRRVLRPGGEVRFYEHVVAERRAGAGVQRWLDRTGIRPQLGAGCHLSRDTLTAIGAAGFEVGSSRRFRVGGLPHVAGVARQPSSSDTASAATP